MAINSTRVKAVVARHVFAWPRDLESLTESFWWPSFDLLIWGLMTVYLQRQQGVPQVFLSFFLSAIILWMFVYRSQQEMGFIFLREAWDRNLLNLFTSPLTIAEFSVASLILGGIKLLISAIWMILLGWLLFAFNVFAIGWLFIPFVVNLLLVGWSAGFVINGLIIRYGYRVQAFAWSLVLILQPFSAVFYPVDVLPSWMQVVASVLPTSYIFEGMRTSLAEGRILYENLLIATGLNVFYLCLGIWFFARSFRRALEIGMLQKFA